MPAGKAANDIDTTVCLEPQTIPAINVIYAVHSVNYTTLTPRGCLVVVLATVPLYSRRTTLTPRQILGERQRLPSTTDHTY